jgi:hypothetical protein
MKIKAGRGRFQLKQNVTYEVFNRFIFMDNLAKEGVTIPVQFVKIRGDLNKIYAYALKKGLNKEKVEAAKLASRKQIFQENGFTQWLIKHNLINPASQFIKDISSLAPFIFGAYADKKVISNLITSAGKAGVASRINGSGGEAAFTYIAVGIGTTAANVADTTLESEITDSGLQRAAATASRVTVDVTNDGARLVLTFTVSGTKAVTESGVLNAGASGVLLARQVFSAINVVSGDSLQVTWTFDVD